MTGPIFRDMTPDECEALLSVNHVGRLAFTFKDRVDIQPIHYVFDNGWIFGRTAEGAKFTTLTHHPFVAFEVDEVHGLFDWRSVVAHGTVYLLDKESGPVQASEYDRALDMMRRFLPETFTSEDPTPFRTIVFGIQVMEMTGREAREGKRRRSATKRRTK